MDRESVKKRLAMLDKESLVALATEFGVTGKKSTSQIISHLLDLRYGQSGSGIDDAKVELTETGNPIVWTHSGWRLLRSRNKPEVVFYNKIATGESSIDLPKELVKMTNGWIKFGKDDFFNEITHATQKEPPNDAKFMADIARDDFQFSPACLKGYEIKQILGAGSFGQVSVGCLADDCTYAVKLQRIFTMPEEFDKEVEVSKIASQNAIGPKFYGAWTCENGKIGVIVTEKWDKSLEKYLLTNKIKKSLVDKYQQLIEQLHSLGYVHIDLQPKNVLVKIDKNGDAIDIALTDFGTAEKVDTRLSKKYEQMFLDYHKKCEATRDFFKDKKIEWKDIHKNYKLYDGGLLYNLRKLVEDEPVSKPVARPRVSLSKKDEPKPVSVVEQPKDNVDTRLNKCAKPPSLGGYPFPELIELATKLGIAVRQSDTKRYRLKEEICNDIKALLAQQKS